MILDKDLSKATKPELVQILRLCIGKHCDECPLANEFDRDACYRILMVRCIDEFKNDRKRMDEALELVKDVRRGLAELKESIGKTFEVGEAAKVKLQSLLNYLLQKILLSLHQLQEWLIIFMKWQKIMDTKYRSR